MTLIDGLAAYYKFDENTGTTSVDSTGIGNTGTFTGTTPYWAPGKINSGSDYTANDTVFTVTTVAAQNNFNQVSVSFWAAITAAGNFGGIFKKNDGTASHSRLSLELDAGVPNKLRIVTKRNGGTQGIWDVAMTWDTTFRHYIITYDMSSNANNPIYYINGVSQSTPQTLVPTLSPFADGTNLTIGVGGPRGVIDEVGYWGKILTQAEVTQLYNNGNGLPFSNFVEWYINLSS